MTIGERIKKVRRSFDLTQQEFADKIGSKRNTVATYEMGRTDPSTAVISLICREFNVSETWLRTGEGEMFRKLNDDEELEWIFKAISTSDDESIKRVIRAYWRLSDSGKAGFRELLDNLVAEYESGREKKFAPAVPERTQTDTSGQERTGADRAGHCG